MIEPLSIFLPGNILRLLDITFISFPSFLNSCHKSSFKSSTRIPLILIESSVCCCSPCRFLICNWSVDRADAKSSKLEMGLNCSNNESWTKDSWSKRLFTNGSVGSARFQFQPSRKIEIKSKADPLEVDLDCVVTNYYSLFDSKRWSGMMKYLEKYYRIHWLESHQKWAFIGSTVHWKISWIWIRRSKANWNRFVRRTVKMKMNLKLAND